LQAEIAAFLFHQRFQQHFAVAFASKNPVHKQPVDLRHAACLAVQRKRGGATVCAQRERF